MNNKSAFEALLDAYAGECIGFAMDVGDRDKRMKARAAVLAAYDAATAVQGGEPVAWIYTRSNETESEYRLTTHRWERYAKAEWREQPLYAAAPPVQVKGEAFACPRLGYFEPPAINSAAEHKVWHDHYYEAFTRWLQDDSTHWIGDSDAAWQAWMYLHEEGLTPIPDAAMSGEGKDG